MTVPFTTPIPGVGQYGQAGLAAKTAYDTTLRKINDRRSQTLRSSGYLGDIDPASGSLSNLRVDPLNQYGGLQSMLRGQAQAAQGAQFDAEERGLHGGLAHKADSQIQYDAGQQSAQFGQDLTNTLGGLQGEQTQAANDRDSALWTAEQQAAQDAINNGDFNPADFSGVQYPDYGDIGPPGAGPYTTGGVKKAAPLPSRDALIRRLMAQGVKPSTWARNHPTAAAQLGIHAKFNSNNALIKRVMAAAKHRKGG